MRKLSTTVISLLLGAATVVTPIAAQAQDNGRGRDRGAWQGGGGGGGDQARPSWQGRSDRGAMMNGDARHEAFRQSRDPARTVDRPAARMEVSNDSGCQWQGGGRNWSGSRDNNRGD